MAWYSSFLIVFHCSETSYFKDIIVNDLTVLLFLGRLTLTNYALYFEESGVISYKDALTLNLSEDFEQSIKPAATGPWGAPLFDKAIVYSSSEL